MKKRTLLTLALAAALGIGAAGADSLPLVGDKTGEVAVPYDEEQPDGACFTYS